MPVRLKRGGRGGGEAVREGGWGKGEDREGGKRKCTSFKVESFFPNCWVGQKVCLGFCMSCYRKTWMNFLANPISTSILTLSMLY